MAENRINMRFSTQTDQASQSVRRLSQNLTSLGRSTRQIETDFGRVQRQVRSNRNQFNNMTNDVNRMSTSMRNLTLVTQGLRRGLSSIGIYFLARGLHSATQGALDMIEVNNLFAVSLGESRHEANEFADSMTRVYGLDNTNVKSAIGTFALLGRSMGFNVDNARKLSEGVYSLGLDLSSLTNVPINQVMQDLRSGLVGQSETVYKYGLDVTEASLKQEAMSQGIEKSVRNMSQGEKMALRYSVMIKRSALANSDFAKTIESPANQLRILGERFTTLIRSIGTLFIPLLSNVLPYLNAFVTLLTSIVDKMAILVGYTPSEAQGAMGDFAESADEANSAVTALKKNLTGIDELNIIAPVTSPTGVQQGDPDDIGVSEYKGLLDSLKLKSDEIVESFTSWFSGKDQPTWLINVKDNLDGISDVLSDIALDSGLFKEVVDDVGYVTGIELDTEKFQKFYDLFIEPVVSFGAETLLPSFLSVLESALRILSSTLEIFSPLFESFWDNVILPLTGIEDPNLETDIESLTGALESFATWLEEHEEDFKVYTEALALDLEGFSGTWQTEWDNMVVWLDETSKDFDTSFKEFIRLAKLDLEGFAETWDTEWTNMEVWFTELGGKLATHFGGMSGAFLTAFEALQIVWGNKWSELTISAEEESLGLSDLMAEKFGTTPDKFKTEFDKIKDKFQGWKILTSLWIRQNLPKLVEEFVDFWKELPTKLYNVGSDAITSLWNGIKSMGSWISRQISDFIDDYLSFDLDFSFGSDDDDSKSSKRVGKYASGGFPATGQMFIAREAGAEMVGSINGRTAVANNDQIVSAVATGVAQAVSSVLGGQSSDQRIVVELDGEQIYTNQQKVAQRRGKDFGLGSFAR